MRNRFIWCLGGGLVVAWACTSGLAQQPERPDDPFNQNPGTIQTLSSGSFFPKDGGRDQQPVQLAKQFVKTDKEEEKKEIRKKLTDLLNKQFDQHVQQQQKELEELEKQIANLRSVLKKRSEAKGSIVDRRFEQLVQDAQGLGWNVPSAPRGLQAPSAMPLGVRPGVTPGSNR